jgi:hypothetical protein
MCTMAKNSDNANFYQLRLYSRGKVEIFQRVFFHKIITAGVQNIEVRYSSCLNTGKYTNSTRPMAGVYEIRIIDEPDYEPTTDHCGVEVVLNGKGKFFIGKEEN